MSRLSHDQRDVQKLSELVGQLAAQLPALHAELYARWRYARPDGYRASSLGEGGRPSHETDPITGESIPLPSYSDPTGDTAVTDPTKDQDAITLGHAYRLMNSADAALRSAKGLLEKALRPPPELEEEDTSDPGCTSCRRLRSKFDPNRRVWEPCHDGTLCRWCGAWKAECGEIPAMDVLRDYHDGRRISADRMPPRKLEQSA